MSYHAEITFQRADGTTDVAHVRAGSPGELDALVSREQRFYRSLGWHSGVTRAYVACDRCPGRKCKRCMGVGTWPMEHEDPIPD
jgi:hypothetical protein